MRPRQNASKGYSTRFRPWLKVRKSSQRNAKKSTGPKTAEGKATSRANALKHGLSGAGVVLTDEDRAAVDRRMVEWGTDSEDDEARRRWLNERVAVESIRIERCEGLYFRLCRDHADRASACWDGDRLAEAQALLAKLPGDPPLVRRRLEASAHGCMVLIEAWSFLGQALDDQGDWTEAQRGDALDLIGQPLGYRDGTTLLDPKPGEVADLHAYRREFVLDEIRRLQKQIDGGLGRIDAEARSAAERGGIGAELTAPVREILRLEAACHRRFRWALKALKAPAEPAEPAEPAVAEPPAAPEPAPTPRADRPAVKPPSPVLATIVRPEDDAFESALAEPFNLSELRSLRRRA